jgi:ABC-type nickel/cobalt efflux system permease component RcnA
VILLSAISLGRVGFGLLLIIIFSLGLAAVLIVIGLLTVTASHLSDQISEHREWIQVLPVFSAGVVMIIGIGIAFNSLVAGGILTINH